MDSSKVDLEKIEAMRSMWVMGYGPVGIANALGVGRATVHKYCSHLRQPSRHKMENSKRMRLLLEWR